MTPEEKAALKRDHPNCWFVRVVKDGWSLLVAIPQRPLKDDGSDDPDIKTLPGITLTMLHGATVTR